MKAVLIRRDQKRYPVPPRPLPGRPTPAIQSLLYTIYPYMWAHPDDDASPDGEFATLQGFLSRYRMTILMKCEGIDPAQLATRSVSPSAMSLLGLRRHPAEDEWNWRNWISDGYPLPKIYGPGDADFDNFVAVQGGVDHARTTLARERLATEAALAGHPDLGERLGKDRISVRELHVHRIEEYARHSGYAESLRDCIQSSLWEPLTV